MSNRRLAVVTSLIALVMGALGVSVMYSSMDPESESPMVGIFDFCVGGDASSCYSFAGLRMAEDRGMALAALEICASDSKATSRFDCMYKLAAAHQTGRSGQRNFVLAYRWYSALIAEKGPAALVDVGRNRLRSAELVMSRDQISMAQAQMRSWLGRSAEDLTVPVAVGLETRL
jgi:TPR repeat protein